MRKDAVGTSEYAKHSRNSRLGRRGHNKRVRLRAKDEVQERAHDIAMTEANKDPENWCEVYGRVLDQAIQELSDAGSS